MDMNDTQPHVLMVAVECRDLVKVGGLGDVAIQDKERLAGQDFWCCHS
jgi:glycogen synthase